MKTSTTQKIHKIESEESRTWVISHPSQPFIRNTGLDEAMVRRNVGQTMPGMRNRSARFYEHEAKGRFKISRAI